MKESMPEQTNIQKQIDVPKDESQLIFERYKEEGRTSGDYWYSRVVENVAKKTPEELEKGIIEALKAEVPMMLSAIMERTCVYECKHCIFKKEESSQEESERVGFGNIINNIVVQMPNQETSHRNTEEKPMFVHNGRVLRDWHLDIFKNIKEKRPDMEIGLIDNGTYTRYLDKFKEKNIKLNWVDISVDGTKEFHNLQRNSLVSFDGMMNGLKHAREIIVLPENGGKVTSLFTLTNLNYKDKNIEKTTEMLFPQESNQLVDELHISTMSPFREELAQFEISPHYKEGDVEEFKEAWDQIKNVFNKYGYDDNGKQRIFLKIYRHEDIEKLANAVGPKKFIEAVSLKRDQNGEIEKEQSIGVDIGHMEFVIDGVPVTFFPFSTWPQETFFIDADGAYRTAFSSAFTLKELQEGKDENNKNLKGYTVDYLKTNSDFIKEYHKCVDQWWNFKGKNYLKEEIEMFDRIKKLSEEKAL